MQRASARYPFDLYGSLVVEADLGFALETQTLELIDTSWFDDYGQGVWEPTMLHELSHMWFGDSVSPDVERPVAQRGPRVAGTSSSTPRRRASSPTTPRATRTTPATRRSTS